MANNTVWQVLHFLCILAHMGMFAAGIATFVVNGTGDVTNGDVDPDDFSVHVVYPWAVGGIGIAGIAMNAAIFSRMLKVSKPLDRGTKNKQYFRRKVAFGASLILQISMTAADMTIGGIVAGTVSEKGDLAAPCALAIMAGVVSLATGLVDISQFNDYRQRNEGVGIDSIEFADA